jgi:hypothetical protein
MYCQREWCDNELVCDTKLQHVVRKMRHTDKINETVAYRLYFLHYTVFTTYVIKRPFIHIKGSGSSCSGSYLP